MSREEQRQRARRRAKERALANERLVALADEIDNFRVCPPLISFFLSALPPHFFIPSSWFPAACPASSPLFLQDIIHRLSLELRDAKIRERSCSGEAGRLLKVLDANKTQV